ncbi:SDR family oxidoreductase [Thermopolyspora sp. NPDC052614]|uniref:SDR family oxidoreductase n=1 Tax=Thermopolyspora sp. NPDC052614 TaxID=3155682 RepID=UPI0034252168
MSATPHDAVADPKVPGPADLFDLTGKTALVTGASSGLGVHFAIGLRHAGASVYVAARRVDRLNDLCARHPGLIPIACDVSDEDSVAEAAARINGEVGALDILVNNAGTSVPSRAEHESMADFRYVMDVNVHGTFKLTQLLARPMLDAGRGSIINIASILGLVAASPNRLASYCASKGALISLTRELAVQWARRGVRVNAIAPGFFPSELTTELMDGPGHDYITRNTPMARTGDPNELLGTLLLLAGDAGTFITGQVIAVDGGWTAR